MVFLLGIGLAKSDAQLRFDVGVTMGYDLYHQLHNPTDSGSVSRSISTGFSVGPKVWIGGNKWSLGLDAAFGIAPVAFDWSDYVGLGAIYVPAKLSLGFAGLSGSPSAKGWGVAVAAGVQLTRTDLYALADEAEDRSISSFSAVFGEVRVGLGHQGRNAQAFVRVGQGEDAAAVFHIGVLLDANLSGRSRARKNKEW